MASSRHVPPIRIGFSQQLNLLLASHLCSCLLLALASPVAAQGSARPQDSAVLRHLKELDSKYLDCFTFEVEEREDPQGNRIWDQPIISKCVLTADKATGRKALLREVTSDSAPNVGAVLDLQVGTKRIGGFIPIGSAASVSADSFGNRTIHFRTSYVCRVDQNVSGVVQTLVPFVISPTRQLTRGSALTLLDLNTGDSIQFIHEEWRLMLISGRGYSRFFDEVTEIQELPKGLIEISAKCFQDANPGRFSVVVDPASSYLVRQCRYYRPNDERPIVRLTTEGTMTKGGFSTPKTANWEDSYLRGFVATYSFKDGRFGFDEPTYQKSEELVKAKAPYPPGALVSDARLVPEENFQADAEGMKPEQPPPDQAVPGNSWLSPFIAANCVLCALLATGYAVKRHGRRRLVAKAPS